MQFPYLNDWKAMGLGVFIWATVFTLFTLFAVSLVGGVNNRIVDEESFFVCIFRNLVRRAVGLQSQCSLRVCQINISSEIASIPDYKRF